MIKPIYTLNMLRAVGYFLFFLVVCSYAQGKKNVRKYNIRMMIETITDGKMTYKSEQRTFDANGNELEWIKYNKDGSIVRKKVFKYDKNGKLTEEQEYAGNQLHQKIVYAYNKFDEKISEITYDATGQVVKKEIFEYNNKGLKSEKKVFDKNDHLTETHIYKYYSGKNDEQGKSE